ncbi:hypothetical protein EB796_015725 [Bugula neritina]|uniref:CCHC-type domain-containing protein n=1 Tax=Bugula neritina TaxID=10212 RepID=A0A7J7JI09_BUGNE|nr:hypothetical protein EB796_015725 [Bugula neritina]
MHARQKLKERYGSMFDVGRTMRDTLSKWPKVQGGDAQARQKYADYLQQCLFGKPYEDRINFLRSKNLCYACGEPGHGWQICKMKNKNNCRKCNKPGHPTCLHKTKEDWNQQRSSMIPDSQESFNSKAETSSHTDMNMDKTGASFITEESH